MKLRLKPVPPSHSMPSRARTPLRAPSAPTSQRACTVTPCAAAFGAVLEVVAAGDAGPCPAVTGSTFTGATSASMPWLFSEKPRSSQP